LVKNSRLLAVALLGLKEVCALMDAKSTVIPIGKTVGMQPAVLSLVGTVGLALTEEGVQP
jgi:hypothetical protein